MLSEFKSFLLRGDVLALAVAVIIGGAFSEIVNSLVNDIISPLIGLATGGVDFSKYELGGFALGKFINAIIRFIIIGFILFLLVKAAGKKAEEVLGKEVTKKVDEVKDKLNKWDPFKKKKN